MACFKNKRTRTAMNVVISILVPVCWFWLAFHMHGESFTANGVRSLKYFTVLSNLAAGAAALVWLLFPEKEWVRRLKLASEASVTITCLVVIGFLGPIFGYPMMYAGANLWFHLLIPLLCMIDAVLLENHGYSIKDCLWGIVPVLLYGSVYVGNILVNGTEGNDWYGFARWGVFPVGLMIFLGLILLAYGISLLTAYLQRITERK